MNRTLRTISTIASALLVFVAPTWARSYVRSSSCGSVTRSSGGGSVSRSASGEHGSASRSASVDGGQVSRSASASGEHGSVSRSASGGSGGGYVSRDVDVDVHRNYSYHHPTGRVVVGTVLYTPPPDYTVVVVGGVTYYRSGSVWYQPRFVGTTTAYVVVPAPQ